MNENTLHDLIGVGFGPSNLALAIALEEQVPNTDSLKALFLDRQENYQWHGNTLVSQSELQISFLKDLVSLRNPESQYSFVNYLHKHQRLVDFINLGTLYPCRMEFNDYLRWVAGHFKQWCRYGEAVQRIEPVLHGGTVEHLNVISRNADGVEYRRETRALVVSAGGTPKFPAVFEGLRHDSRVFHHAEYLSRLKKIGMTPATSLRVAIIGSGQSAAEAFIDLNDCHPGVRADLIFRGSALKPSDSTPFVNEIFAPDFTDLIFRQEPAERARIIREYHNTNYSVVDADLIERIYRIFYRQKVENKARHTYRRLMQVQSARADEAGIWLDLQDMSDGQMQRECYDLVILATGYERKSHRQLLAPLEQYLGDFEVDRRYRIQTDGRCKPAIYMQGFCEATHGLSDTLLSVLPFRASEIAASLREHFDNETPLYKRVEMAPRTIGVHA